MKQLLQRRTSNQLTVLTSLCSWELERSVLSFPDSDCDCDQFGTVIQSHVLLYAFNLDPRYRSFTQKISKQLINISGVFLMVQY